MAYSTQYDALIQEYAASYGIPAALAIAQNHAEDGSERPDAQSAVGAEGLFQLMPATVVGLLQNNLAVLRKVLAIPEVSVILGTFFDSQLKAQVTPWFPDPNDQWKATMAAYNCGAGRLHQAITACSTAGKDATQYASVEPFLPAESQTYVQRIWAEFAQADNSQA